MGRGGNIEALMMPCAAQIKDKAPDAPVKDRAQFVAAEEVKARAEIVELSACEQPTDFALTLNVLAIIQLSEYKVGSTVKSWPCCSRGISRVAIPHCSCLMRALVPQIKESDLLDLMRQLDVPLNRGESLNDKLADLKAQLYIDVKEEKDEEDQKQVCAGFVLCA
jgi:hypothetical protein